MSSKDADKSSEPETEAKEPTPTKEPEASEAKKPPKEPEAEESTEPKEQKAAEESAEPEEQPQGPSLQFWLVVLGVILAGVIWGYRGTPSKAPVPVLEPGTVVDAPITLITMDRHELSCAMPGDLQGYKCVWSDPNTKADPPADPAHTLAPYMTTNGQLFLVAGLFEQPSVRARYERERPEGKKREELRRFTANCKLKLLAEAPEIRLQFALGSPWGEAQRAWVGVPSDCSITHP